MPGPREGFNEEHEWRQLIADLNNPRVTEQWIYSPAMDRTIPFVVIHADKAAGPQPTIYLLNGGGGGEDRMNWITRTDAIDFYLDKNVNVVVPMEGKYSYYTDWVEPNEGVRGVNKWETFLTKELPAPIEKWLGANGQRAVAGMSMTATTPILYAEHNPGFYNAIGSFSGCAETTNTWLGERAINATLNRIAGGKTNVNSMWGPAGSESWNYNDSFAQVKNLEGQAMYVSSGSGLLGQWDVDSSPFTGEAVPTWVSIVSGGVIEGAVNMCTHNFHNKLKQEGVSGDQVFNFRPNGTHSWGYWQDDLRGSWEVFNRSFGRA